VDKLTLAALEATLMLYREPERAIREIPTLSMLAAPAADVRERAERLARQLGSGARVVESEATVGGGAFPTSRIASFAVAIDFDAATVEERLRTADPAVVGRVSGDQLLLDVRTVLPDDEEDFVSAVRRAVGAASE